jgi:hypothetical protein
MKGVTMRTALGLALLLALARPALADDKDKKADLPVKAKLVAAKTTYALDLQGMTAADFRKAIEEGAKSGKTPKPPAVDLTLELTNTSDKDVSIWVKGDATRVVLDLKGKGAVSVTPRRAFTGFSTSRSS